MGETEAEVRLEKKINFLQSQINNLGVQLKRLHGQMTHPSVLTRIKKETLANRGDLLGTVNQVIVTHGEDAVYRSDDVTLNLPQNIHTGAIPIFAGLGLGTATPDTVAHFKVDNATPVIRLERNDMTIGTDDIVGRLEVEGQDAGAAGICAMLEAIAEGNAGETGWRFSCGVAGTIAEFLRLTYLGYLGLGTSEPDAQFHIEDVTGAVQRLTRKDTTVTAADLIGRLEFEIQDAGGAGIGAFIQAEAEGSVGEVGVVIGVGVGGAAVERVRIKNTGVVNIYLPPTYATNAAALLGGLASGDIYRTGGLTDFLCIVHP